MAEPPGQPQVHRHVERPALVREVLVELAGHPFQPGRRVQDARTDLLGELRQRGVVTLVRVGHPDQALLGTLLLAATEQGLVRVAYPSQGHDAALAQLADLVSPRILNAPGRLDEVARQLDEYFSRRRRAFDVPVDLRLSKGFRYSVLTHLRQIPYGATESYAQVAAATGHPRAVRAAGTACATNPVPIVVPCHRVVRSDGSPGGYAGGPDAKRSLLTLEAA